LGKFLHKYVEIMEFKLKQKDKKNVGKQKIAQPVVSS
jgi:hypothetical protein